jgi:hypothetical protein
VFPPFFFINYLHKTRNHKDIFVTPFLKLRPKAKITYRNSSSSTLGASTLIILFVKILKFSKKKKKEKKLLKTEIK